jgi:hypothetical protein
VGRQSGGFSFSAQDTPAARPQATMSIDAMRSQLLQNIPMGRQIPANSASQPYRGGNAYQSSSLPAVVPVQEATTYNAKKDPRKR